MSETNKLLDLARQLTEAGRKTLSTPQRKVSYTILSLEISDCNSRSVSRCWHLPSQSFCSLAFAGLENPRVSKEKELPKKDKR